MLEDFNNQKDNTLILDNNNNKVKELKEQFQKNHQILVKENKIKGVSPIDSKSFKVPTPLKFLSILVSIYMGITLIMYILTYMGIPIMAI